MMDAKLDIGLTYITQGIMSITRLHRFNVPMGAVVDSAHHEVFTTFSEEGRNLSFADCNQH